MKKDRWLRYKETGHTFYDCSKKGKIIAISIGVHKNNNSLRKE